ncbi:MAG: hypothetical protein FWG34_08530 [Oscillospiraceae bacterium]|nr:hypothetical protein [Oscillospiraceae bacterium]
MIYFGENKEYILCECEACKGEMYIEKTSVSDEDAYAYHLASPIKCRCGAIDEYINRAKKSCHKIKQELFSLSDLLHKQQNIASRTNEITSELNKKFSPPSFMQSVAEDFMFSLKVFFIMLGAAIGVEIFLFVITALMFFFGIAFQAENIAENGNELFYAINVFKGQGGDFLSNFGFDSAVRPLSEYGTDPSEGLIFDYVPAAVAGLVIVVFYVFLAVLLVRVGISVSKLTFFASKVMNQKIKINQKREEYKKQLDDFGIIYQNLEDQIGELAILPDDYKNVRAADSILQYFVNNRADSIREAIALFHDEDFKVKLLEYSKGLYSEAKQTRRYTKAMYMMTSDENIKVDIKEPKEESPENGGAGKSAPSEAFSKIKSPSPQKSPRLNSPKPGENPESKTIEAPKKPKPNDSRENIADADKSVPENDGYGDDGNQ